MSASAPADSFFVYILKCTDSTFYVGHTTNIEKRVKAHSDGRGAAWTSCRRPVTLVYVEPLPSDGEAIARERQIKQWTHAKKLALINGHQAKLKSLAKRRIR